MSRNAPKTGRKALATSGARKTASPTKAVFLDRHRGIEKLRVEGRLVAYRIGVHLCAVRDQKLWKAGGFATFDAYLHSFPGVSARTLYRYVSYAAAVPESLAKRYDPLMIELGLKLLPQGREPVVVTREAFEKLRVSAVRDGKTTLVPFAEARPEELAAEVARRERKALPALGSEVERRLERLHQRFGAGPGAMADVHLRRRGKRATVNIEFPIERLGEIEKLLGL